MLLYLYGGVREGTCPIRPKWVIVRVGFVRRVNLSANR